MLTAARRLAPRRSWKEPRSTASKHRNLASLPLLALLVLFAPSISAQSASQAFTQTTLSLEWSESAEQQAANLQSLNSAFAASKGSTGARFANYSIRNAGSSMFELYDREGRYITVQDRADYSHELEIRLKSSATIDFEALPSSKQLTLVVDAVAKSETEIRRLVHSSEVDAALAARDRLNTPSSLTVSITVTDFDERPVVASQYEPSTNHRRGFLLRMNADGGAVRIRGDSLFLDPEKRPLYFKPNSEDVEIREFLGYSPNFGTRTVSIGSTELDTNYLSGNSPSTDGTIVNVSVEASTIVLTPVKGDQDGIQKAEVWVRGWDQRGPTAVLPRLDPATAESLAKITVLVQTGQNRLPQWPGNATGFSISVDEGFTGPLAPERGTWNATDPDNDQITYSLLDTSTRDACASPTPGPGISFAGACIRLDSTTSVVFNVYGEFDFETVRANPIGRFTLAATDSRGAVSEASFTVRVDNVVEPIEGGFRTRALSIYLPTTTVKRFDLSELFKDPEERGPLSFRAISGNSTIVSVNEIPDPVLQITALKLGRTTIHAWATSPSGGTLSSSLTVVVKDENNPPEFPGGVTRYQVNVAENAPIGTTLLPSITASDSDFGDVLSFSLQENAHFRLSDEGLQVNQIQLATKALLDFETQPNYVLTLTVSDDVDSDSVEVYVNLTDIDESVLATAEVIAPISLSVNGMHSFDASTHFVDDEGQTPHIRVTGFDSTIVDILVRSDGHVQIFAKRNGATEATLTASDTSGGIAAKRFSILVERSEPPVVSRPIADQSMQLGLLELSLASLFSDPDSTVSIVEVSSSNEDVLWAIQPRSDPDTLVLYAWMNGTAEITILARDPNGNEASHSFTVTVTDEEAPVTEALIPDQTLTVGQRLGTLSLLQAFSTAEEQPTSFSASSSQPATVNAMVANTDVIAWWEALSCAQKVVAVADTGMANASNPYCQDFISLSVQHKVIVRAVAAHHVLLHGISVGSAQITVSATYASGAVTTTTFTAAVEAMAASVAASTPQRVGYLDETFAFSVQDLLGVDEPVMALKAAALEGDIASVSLGEDGQTVDVHGLELGTATVALIGKDAAGQHHAIQFSVRIENRAPEALSSNVSWVLEVGDEPHVQDLNDIFSDVHALRFELIAEETRVVEASVQESNLIVSPLHKGSTQLSVRATDPYAGSGTALIEITVSEDRLNEAASDALAGYGRAILNSVSSVIGSRVKAPLHVPDLQPEQPLSDGHRFDIGTAPDIDLATRELGSPDQPLWSGRVGPNASTLGGITVPSISQTFARSDDSSYWTLWSNSDSQSYRGDGHRGQTRSYYVGTDVVLKDRIQAGVAGLYTTGSNEYTYGNAARWIETEQTFVSPYVRYQPRKDTSIWGIATIGSGKLATATRVDETPTETHELSTSALILGAASNLANVDGLDLDWTVDVAHLSMNADAVDQDQVSLVTHVQRARSGLSATYSVPISSSVILEPFASLNVRYDSGSDQEGGGLETIAGARLVAGAFDVEIRGRRFELRDESSYLEQGLAISTTYNPSKDLRGWSFSLVPSWGSSLQTIDPFSSNYGIGTRSSAWAEPDSPLMAFGIEGSLNYGILMGHERFVLTPYLQTRSHAERDHRFGLRLQGITQSTQPLELDFMVQRTKLLSSGFGTGVVVSASLRL